MWLRLENEGSELFSPVNSKTTIGSALSNAIVLKGRGVSALHGLIIQRNGVWNYQDFIHKKSFELEVNSYFQIGDFNARFLPEEDLWKDYGEFFLKHLKKILNEQKQFDFEKALSHFRNQFFLSQELPASIGTRLKTRFAEYRLEGPIETLLQDPGISDILVESFDQIWIEKNGQLQSSLYQFTSQESYQIYIENLLAKLQLVVDEAKPYADFVLPDGSRAHLIRPPLTSSEAVLSIRKIKSQAWKLEDLLKLQMFDSKILSWMESAIEQKKNILISGATGSGKTTLLRALLMAIPSLERFVVLEDTPELSFVRQNSVFLKTRDNDQSDYPPIKLRDLVRQSLRMRPDRLIIGEVRGEEALDLLHAMNTGHQGCFGSLHANSCRDALWRLQGLVRFSKSALSEIAIMDLISRNLSAVIHCGRRRGGQRRIVEVSELEGICEGQFILKEVYSDED